MIKVMFVCLGNICRSPMAEFVLKELVRRQGMENEFYIESSATSNEEIGNGVHYGTLNKLNSIGIPVESRRAKKLTKKDYEEFDYIIAMEESNIRNIINNPRDIADHWYTGNFDKTYEDILEGCNAFLKSIEK